MRIGFTGTRVGMSGKQKKELKKLLMGASEFHHGDCVGADAEADQIARELGVRIFIHPPEIKDLRAYCYQPADVMFNPRPYLDRNKDIVNSTDFLIGAPSTDNEQMRSGTWSTIRYGRKVGKRVVILRRK
jgi:hypothetical protein